MWLWRRARTSEFDFFEERVGQLLLDGHHVGHIASRLYWAGAGFAFLRPVPMPTFVITWLDGSHEFCAEDTAPYEFSHEARAGRVRWEVKQPHMISNLSLTRGQKTDFTVSWLDDAESHAVWPQAGIPDDPPYWELGPEDD